MITVDTTVIVGMFTLSNDVAQATQHPADVPHNKCLGGYVPQSVRTQAGHIARATGNRYNWKLGDRLDTGQLR